MLGVLAAHTEYVCFSLSPELIVEGLICALKMHVQNARDPQPQMHMDADLLIHMDADLLTLVLRRFFAANMATVVRQKDTFS